MYYLFYTLYYYIVIPTGLYYGSDVIYQVIAAAYAIDR